VSFDLQPILKGDLVELRPLRADDYEDLSRVAADPLIWEQHPVRNRHEEEPFRAFFRAALASNGALIAMDARTRRVIGSSRFHGYDKERSEVEIGRVMCTRLRPRCSGLIAAADESSAEAAIGAGALAADRGYPADDG
jgi:N-acetyltransferase